MFYCFVNPSDIDGGTITIRGENFRHLKTVLHAGPGETIRVRSDRFVYEARIDAVEKEKIAAKIISAKETGNAPTRRIVLCQALIQEKNFDLALQQAVQLGVSSVRPLLTRNVANHRMKPGKKERWEKIVLAAAMQSQRLEIPAVAEAAPFEEVLAGFAASKGARLIMPYELEEKRTIDAALFENSAEIALFIGPEGGWSAEEVGLARDRGVVTVTLGPHILRSETAALVGLTLVFRSLGVL